MDGVEVCNENVDTTMDVSWPVRVSGTGVKELAIYWHRLGGHHHQQVNVGHRRAVKLIFPGEYLVQRAFACLAGRWRRTPRAFHPSMWTRWSWPGRRSCNMPFGSSPPIWASLPWLQVALVDAHRHRAVLQGRDGRHPVGRGSACARRPSASAWAGGSTPPGMWSSSACRTAGRSSTPPASPPSTPGGPGLFLSRHAPPQDRTFHALRSLSS